MRCLKAEKLHATYAELLYSYRAVCEYENFIYSARKRKPIEAIEIGKSQKFSG